MAASSAITGKGATLGYSATSGGSYTLLSEVVDCNIPEITFPGVEKTHYTSDNSRIEKTPTGWGELGDNSVQLNYVKAQTTTLYTLVGQLKWWKLTLSDGSTYVWNGWISKLGHPVPNKDRILQTGAFTNTGDITFTAGS
jgi:hypothetical protein